MFENPQKANKVPTVEYKRVNLVLYVGFCLLSVWTRNY